MRVRWCVLLVGFSILLTTACGDGGPEILGSHKSSLIQFKRVTLASDAPGRAEIEIEVLTGSDFSEPAPDGTAIVVKTSSGFFDGGSAQVELNTVGGRALATMVLPGATHLLVTAATDGTESRLRLIVEPDGSLQLDPA